MSDHPSNTAPIRLLLVDDDENVHPLIKYLLSKIPGNHFKIEWAATFQTGWEMIQLQKHDIYLVDYRLGVKNGLDLIRKVISSGIQAPIIILTGSDNPMVDLAATKIGVADFLIKDRLDSSTLERSIRYAMQHFETLRDLQKSHERFRLLFERSRDAILISADNGQLIEVNSAACQLLGYPPEKLAQFKISDLFSSDLDNQSMQLGESSSGEVSLHRPDGERHFAEFSACHFGPNLNLCILRDISDRRKLEKEIQEISEKEQRRLGQDLHDGIGQMLTGINFLAKVLQQKLAAKNIEESKDAAHISSLINPTLSQTRQVARGLCPVVLENNDIHAALQQLSDNLVKMFGINSHLLCDPQIKIQDNAVAVHLYRVAQEATTNALKHGKAKNIDISLTQSKGRIILRIKDNGAGMPAKNGAAEKGMGLRVMQHRARMMNATLEIQRRNEGGELVTCLLANGSTHKEHEEKISLPVPPLKRKKRTAQKKVLA